MRRLRSTLAIALVAASTAIACTEAVPGPSGTGSIVQGPEPKPACLAPRSVLVFSSPFHAALVAWNADPPGSTRALAAMDQACDAAMTEDPRGTEHAACTLLGLVHASGEGPPRSPRKAFAYLARGAVCGMDFGGSDLAQAERRSIKSESAACCGGLSCERGCESECAQAMEQVRAELEPPLRAACARGRGVGCFMLATLACGQHLQRIGAVQPSAPLDEDDLFEKSCRAGVGPACEWRAYRFSDDEPASKRTWLERACDAGWGSGCHALAMALDATGARTTALPYWEKACGLGLLDVCHDLGDILSNGEGVPIDHARAARIYAKANR